jgi:hypothetical protein
MSWSHGRVFLWIRKGRPGAFRIGLLRVVVEVNGEPAPVKQEEAEMSEG